MLASGTGSSTSSGLISLASGASNSGVSGALLLKTGAAVSGNSGMISLVTGTSASSGTSGGIVIKVGEGVSATGGSISITAGSGSGVNGGGVHITGGSSDQTGGAVNVIAGSSNGAGGSVLINAGSSSTETGGLVTISSGAGTATSSGALTFSTPNAGTSGTSGVLTFSTGTTSAGSSGERSELCQVRQLVVKVERYVSLWAVVLAAGGDVSIVAGATTAGAAGGIITLSGGATNGASAAGNVVLKGGDNSDAGEGWLRSTNCRNKCNWNWGSRLYPRWYRNGSNGRCCNYNVRFWHRYFNRSNIYCDSQCWYVWLERIAFAEVWHYVIGIKRQHIAYKQEVLQPAAAVILILSSVKAILHLAVPSQSRLEVLQTQVEMVEVLQYRLVVRLALGAR